MSEALTQRLINKKLRERAKAIAHLLPRGYRDIINEKYPEYNNVKGYQLISNVVAGRSPHQELTKILEAIVQKATSKTK
ncbi:MAG: hypothetical protein ACXVC2_12675 [Bacteroidia bacterium]